MNILQAMALGAIQGLAEFLPISSSGHLALAAYFMKQQDIPLLFDILLHIATLLAVCLVFWQQITSLFQILVRFIAKKPREGDEAGQKMILSLLIATFLTAVIGFLIKDYVETLSPVYISVCLIITGLLLFFSSHYTAKKPLQVPGFLQSVVVGIAQGIGVIPGISRSGITISASLLSGIDRKAAGEFSFLLSIPAIFGAFILELKNADSLNAAVSVIPLLAGMATAFAVGYAALKILLGLIKRGKLGWFAYYLVPVGIALTIYFIVA